MEKQLLGTQEPLSKGPRSTEYDGKTGHGMEQLTGTRMPLSYAPVAMDLHNTQSEGTRQTVASQMPLSTTPVRTWQDNPNAPSIGYSKATLRQDKTK